MKQYLKKCESVRPAEEMRLSRFYCLLGSEHRGASELPAISSDTGRRRMRSPDLEGGGGDNWQSECFGTEISTSTGVNFSGEATAPAVEICGELQQVMGMEEPKITPPATEDPRRKTPACAAKTPSAAELEEFFTEAEEYLQKRFAEKYNYDIAKDAPMPGGRYQWDATHI